MASGDNPNRVSRLNKDPFVPGTSFDPRDVFARNAHSVKRPVLSPRFIIAFLPEGHALYL